MGYKVIAGKSVQQIRRHIRAVARDTSLVMLSKHAKAQMLKRKVTRAEVFQCLRSGCIELTPEPNASKGTLEVRMEYYVAGRTCKVVVALDDDDPNMIVVTVIG